MARLIWPIWMELVFEAMGESGAMPEQLARIFSFPPAGAPLSVPGSF